MDKKEIIKRASLLLRDVTPQKFDCGLLCSGACCSDSSALRDALGEDDTEMGMLLFPGEKELLDGIQGFKTIQKHGCDYLVCGGFCNRDFRPLACRIFPYYAKILPLGGYDVIRIKKDLRARAVCPIARGEVAYRANIRFMRNLRRAFRILLKDDEIRDMLLEQSCEIGGLEDFLHAFLKAKK